MRSDHSTPRRARRESLRRVTAVVALLAVTVWLGGLLALGAIAAPVVFSVVPLPSSADAMTLVFRRFDRLVMACAAVVLGADAVRAAARVPFAVSGRFRVGTSALASALAVFEGTSVSARIAALHSAGVLRGIGSGGLELARLHEVAEWCGKAQVALLVAFVVLEVIGLSAPERPS
jgi:uncharacterized protein DUF4149